MFGRIALAFLSAWALMAAGTALADGFMTPVSIAPGPLPSALQNLQRQTGVELLYDGGLIGGLHAPAVQGRLSFEAALDQLLADTNLKARRAASGAWVIERADTAPLAQQDAAVSEILVVGRRTQNSDIRRSELDVQPYTVVTRDEILRAHRDNLDQFFSSRMTANTTVVPPSLQQSADMLSSIDLRGLGADSTLVLVDGRRMPSIPASDSAFRQSDLNGIPLHAIERIEVLTGAAGGIHGFGALGGVVNVVLDRESRGLDLHVTQGISSRGDAHQQGVEARFGHTSGDGATDFVLFASHMEADTVLAGQRDYGVRDRRRVFELTPQYYPGIYPFGNSVGVRSFLRIDPETGEFELFPDLVFKPEFGGARLSSKETFLPIGFAGSTDELVAALTQNAGHQDFSLPEAEAATDLGTNPRSGALLANLRHRFGSGFEAYADAVMLESRGESRGDVLNFGFTRGSGFLAPESPANPFTDYIDVGFPIGPLDDPTQRRFQSTRYSAGLLAELPLDWRGTAAISSGGLRERVSASVDASLLGPLLLFGDPADLDMNPLGDWAAFQRAIAGANHLRATSRLHRHTRFRDQSLRLAGPVFSTAAGPAALTLLAEHRKETVPGYGRIETHDSDGTVDRTETFVASRSSGTKSFYAELRSRLWRRLDLQLAVRHDEEKDDFTRNPIDPEPESIHARFNGTAYTAGAKIAPTSWLTLRGSYATGEQPPPLGTLVELDEETTDFGRTTDPKRGDTDLGADGVYLLKSGGNAGLDTVRASTTSVGAVLTPAGLDGPRIAIDFSRIRRTRDVLSLTSEEIMAHEDAWPERIARAPLTDEDRANGYTAGRVTMFDTRFSNGAAQDVDALDVHADWPRTFLNGRLRLYADATYHMHNVLKAPFQPDVHQADFRDGPLKWRANGGFDWSTDRLTIGANLQYFGSYSILTQGPLSGGNDVNVELQGAPRVPSQSYLDLQASWRLAVQDFGPVEDLTLDLGVVNVLDEAPPRESVSVFNGPGYSRYGDPRQRRFELGVSLHF